MHVDVDGTVGADVTADVDVVVIGLGVGGEETANRLAAAGLSVVGIEHRLVGGECPFWGCVPSKIMIRAGNALAEARRVDHLAGRAQVEPDWTTVAKRIREEATAGWTDDAGAERFTSKGGRLVRGTGTLAGPGLVQVGNEVYRARVGVVLGTGTTPVIPPVPGLAGTPYWTNREAMELAELPESLVVLGGGAIGVELAQVFARFGVRVSVVEGGARVLALEEPESSERVAAALRADGVTVHTGAHAERVEHDGTGFTVHLAGGDRFRGERLLVATGRRAVLETLGLETVGLDPTKRFLETDDRMRAADGIWAVGDLTGHGAFTHMAMYQAGIAIDDILRRAGIGTGPDGAGPAGGGGVGGVGVGGGVDGGGLDGGGGRRADYRALPRVTFTDPEVGAVGLTERQARDRGLNVRVGFTLLSDSTRGWIHEVGDEGFIKLVGDADRGVLVGATSAGPVGGEVLSALVVAVHAEVPVTTLTGMIYAYPTFHRAIETAVRGLLQ
ncbi:NAD(P)/FAD-dependent oxidoreductase [Plantactinospora sp. S1510]|uniref:NAD(P)/FAD-dependent oxidoreductase n=1 Tax=Plantactinospora alkalitolerans TaxID=2789879 RepID=A0ABS0GQJ1_9ACTN|nr:NAD(P)/FAD-dependent oxidoreductase [Plantactinospora alkalitolerans]MBF9128458.1 NAD(P)/FAD-dependent oxidoreductase [Plantactinospora alkalitolerans]